jgi:hypothetical protein
LNWLTHALFLNNLFFGHFGFGGSGNGVGGETVWAHNPGHRLGVPYPNRVVSGRFATVRSFAGISNERLRGARSFSAGSYNSRTYGEGSAAVRSVSSREQASAGGQRFDGSRRSSSSAATGGRTYQSNGRSAVGSRGTVDPNRYNSPVRSYQGPSRSVPQRTTQKFASSYRSASPAGKAPAPSARYASPKMPRSSTPRISKPSKSPHLRARHVSSHSGGHSSGGHSGKHK